METDATGPGLETRAAALDRLLEGMGRIAVAVSGGVDSLTLATIAHRLPAAACEMFHAVSPAVPPDATDRVREQARRQGWILHVVDAGEFGDERYLANPVDRCFHCKTHLYAAIAGRTDATLVSGTNTDDLGEYRPGLDAAARHGVRHPYVEAGIGKADLRRLARRLGMPEVAALPSSPCLASRVETGIGIRPDVLPLVDAAEKIVAREIAPGTVRCRLRGRGIVIELDAGALRVLTPASRERLGEKIAALFSGTGVAAGVDFAAYRTGSAFIGIRHERI